jgi:hypothetical protein
LVRKHSFACRQSLSSDHAFEQSAGISVKLQQSMRSRKSSKEGEAVHLVLGHQFD